MITSAKIQCVRDEIIRHFQPDKIILFGSYAYGMPNEDSDVDLLVVLPFEGRKAKKATEIRLAVRAGFAMDLIPLTPERLEERLAINDFFLREVAEKGRVLYKTNHRGMGREGRGGLGGGGTRLGGAG